MFEEDEPYFPKANQECEIRDDDWCMQNSDNALDCAIEEAVEELFKNSKIL